MLKVEKLSKNYGHFTALREVSFKTGEGQVVGLLGPNGSGKSTLLRILATYLRPGSGRAMVAGRDTRLEALEIKQILGYLPENNILYEQMRVDKFLVFVGAAKGLRGAGLRERFGWCVERCELKGMLAKKCGECSRGMRQRVAFAAAVIHDPKVILLDEPTAGLDPVQGRSFRELIRSLAPGRTILFSSHILTEVAAATERVLILHEGRLLQDTAVPTGADRAAKLEELFLATVQGTPKEAA